MLRFAIAAAALLASIPLSATSMMDKPPKALYSTNRPVADVAQCLTSHLQWLAPPAMAPAKEGDMRIQFSTFGHVFTDLHLRGGATTVIEARGVVGGRVKKNIIACLQAPNG